MSILQKQLAIITEFQGLGSWEERYKLLITKGRELSGLDDHEKTDDSKVRGCSSSVWLHSSYDDVLHFRADSDALLVRGLVALLLAVYNDEHPQDIIDNEPLFIAELDLAQHLSANRANGPPAWSSA